jgi:hypothetical protein
MDSFYDIIIRRKDKRESTLVEVEVEIEVEVEVE